MKVVWSKEQIEDFRQWHERRLTECGYPPEMRDKLAKKREHWLTGLGGKNVK